MRLLYLIDSLFPGGACRSLVSMAPHFVSAGVRLDVAYLVDRPGLHEEFAQAGAVVVSAAASSRVGRLRQAAEVTRALQPDIIHTSLFEADIAGRLAGRRTNVPVVSSLLSLAYGSEQLGDPRLRRWKVWAARQVDRVTARSVVRFHALSRHVAETMAPRLRIPLGRIDVVPRGRDPERLGRRSDARRQEARRRFGAEPRDVVVFSAARQEYPKGLDVLLDAFPHVLERLPAARLVLCGRAGGATEIVRSKSRVAGPRVTHLGVRDDVPDLLCAADVLVVPSRWEGLGGVLLEGMALEAPIVASDLPAVHELLDGGRYGLLVPPERPRELAEAIAQAVQDPQASHLRVHQARRRFEARYTVDRVAAEMLGFYERALRQAAVVGSEPAGARG